jgi:hypothetical protein
VRGKPRTPSSFRRRGIARRLHELDQLSVGIRDEAGRRLPLGKADDRVLEDALAGGAEPVEHGVQVRDAERQVRQAVLMHRPLRSGRRGRAREVQQLDPHAVAREVLGVELRPLQTQERVRRLALDVERVLPPEAEQVAVEAQRALEVGDADADVGEALEREHAVGLARTDRRVQQARSIRHRQPFTHTT